MKQMPRHVIHSEDDLSAILIQTALLEQGFVRLMVYLQKLRKQIAGVQQIGSVQHIIEQLQTDVASLAAMLQNVNQCLTEGCVVNALPLLQSVWEKRASVEAVMQSMLERYIADIE